MIVGFTFSFFFLKGRGWGYGLGTDTNMDKKEGLVPVNAYVDIFSTVMKLKLNLQTVLLIS